MDLYSRASGKFYRQLVFSFIAVSTTVVVADIVEINHKYSLLGIWLCLALVIWIQFARFLSIVLNKKPLLTINEVFVFDRIYNIEYQWSDIKEIVESGSTLYVILYSPDTYLNKIHNPLRRFYCKTYYSITKNTPFKINLSFVNANKNALLEILKMYS